jgi:hypothetical protein
VRSYRKKGLRKGFISPLVVRKAAEPVNQGIAFSPPAFSGIASSWKETKTCLRTQFSLEGHKKDELLEC